MNMARLVHHALVMNTIPSWFWRNALWKKSWFTFWLFTCSFYWKASQRLSLQMLHCVVSGYTHLALSHLKVFCPEVLVRIWNLFSVLVCDKVPVMILATFVLCVFVMNTIPPRSERLSLTSVGWHGGCHPRVFLWRIVKKQRHFGVKFRDENTPHHQDFWRTFAKEFGWHGVFLIVKRCQRGSLRYLHSLVLWYTPLAFTLVRRFLRILGLHGGILFSCLVCAAEQSFVLLLHCVVLRRTSYHHDVREARSQKFGSTSQTQSCLFRAVWLNCTHLSPMVVLPFRCLRRGPSDDQCYICIEWLCGTHEWSCDAHHTIMILEERTLKEVLVCILAVYMQFFIERRLSDYLCICCIVWSRDTHTLRTVAFQGILSTLTFTGVLYLSATWHDGRCSVFQIVQLSNCSSCFVRCMVPWWTPYVCEAALMKKRSSHRSLDWHDGGSGFVLSAKESRDNHVYNGMVWFRTTQYVTMISAERSARGLDWQWSHFFRSLLCLYCVASWWTRYHNDRWGLRSRSRCSHGGAFSFFFFCEEVRLCTITIHALSRQVMTTTQPWPFRVVDLMDLMADILRFSLWGLVVVVAMSGLYGIETDTIPMVIGMMGAIRVSCL